MPISEIPNTATIGTTEYSIAAGANYASGSPQTTDAIVQVFIDFSALAAGDEYEVRGYEKVNAGTQAPFAVWTINGAQGELFVAPAMVLVDGWDWTVKKIAGSDRSIKSSVRKVT
jgi:hypothetical protein